MQIVTLAVRTVVAPTCQEALSWFVGAVWVQWRPNSFSAAVASERNLSALGWCVHDDRSVQVAAVADPATAKTQKEPGSADQAFVCRLPPDTLFMLSVILAACSVRAEFRSESLSKAKNLEPVSSFMRSLSPTT